MPAEEAQMLAQSPPIFTQSGQVVSGNQINVAADYVDRSTRIVGLGDGLAGLNLPEISDKEVE